MRTILFFLGMVLLVQPAFSEDPAGRLKKGEEAYYQNHLDEAKKIYQSLIDEGFQNGHLFYNLGNIAYREGKMGEALCLYEKASLFIPRDADLAANKKFVESKKLQAPDTRSAGERLLGVLFFWADLFTEGELWLLFSLVAGISFLLGSLIWFRPLLKNPALILFLFSVVLGGSLWFKVDRRLRPWAVIVTPEAHARPTFLEGETTLMKLPQGTKVRIFARQSFGKGGEWLQIRLPGGTSGWIRAEDACEQTP